MRGIEHELVVSRPLEVMTLAAASLLLVAVYWETSHSLGGRMPIILASYILGIPAHRDCPSQEQ